MHTRPTCFLSHGLRLLNLNLSLHYQHSADHCSILDTPIPLILSLKTCTDPITTFHPTKEPKLDANNFVSRMYIVKANTINQLQSLASTNECKRTKFECFSALLWKIIAKSGMTDKKISKLGIVVDGRTRIGRGDTEKTKVMAS